MKLGTRALASVAANVLVGFAMSFYGFTAWKIATGEFSGHWDLVIWGNHWALRGVTSLLGFSAAGFICGAVSRKHGSLLSLFGSLPSLLFWCAILGLGASPSYYVPVGYRFAAGLVFILAPYVTIKAAQFGEKFGVEHADHFDSRPGTILGIPRLHYLWIPIYVYFLMIIAAPVSLALCLSFRTALKHGTSILVFVPLLLMTGCVYCFERCIDGASNAYNQLAGLPAAPSSDSLMKNLFWGPGLVIGAFAVLSGCIILFAKLFGNT